MSNSPKSRGGKYARRRCNNKKLIRARRWQLFKYYAGETVAMLIAIVVVLVKKITKKSAIATIAVCLAVVAFLPTMFGILNMVAVDLNAGWNSPRVAQDTEMEPLPVITLDAYDGVVTSPEMAGPVEIPETLEQEDAMEVLDMSVSAYGPKNHYVYNFSDEDKLTMAKIVYVESRGECFEGKVAVAAVIINRYVEGGFGSSIYKIATRKNQFSGIGWVTESMLAEVPECMEAVEQACRGWDPTREVFEDGALFFYAYEAELSPEARAARENVEKMYIGNHAFHRELDY